MPIPPDRTCVLTLSCSTHFSLNQTEVRSFHLLQSSSAKNTDILRVSRSGNLSNATADGILTDLGLTTNDYNNVRSPEL